jgi:glycine cleavage system aminomethyltransferase T
MALEGFDLTPDFGDPAAEARACRTDCALFDFSFIETAGLAGKAAQAAIEITTGRSLITMGKGEICYALRVGAGSELVSDLTIWKTDTESFEVMSGRREDIADLLNHAGPGIEAADLTGERAVFAVQGPRSLDSLRKLGAPDSLADIRYFNFCNARLARIPCRIGRLGYTGEPGFEIIVGRDRAPDLWEALSKVARPAGFIAADTLRIEAGFVLFTNEFRLPVYPREARLEKFCGAIDARAPKITLVSFTADTDHQAWPWRPSRKLQRPVERGAIAVTSACKSALADSVLCLGYVPAENAPNAALNDPSGVFRNIRLTPLPFYDTAKRRPRAPWR